MDLFVCFTHFPVYPSRERACAFLELADGYDEFRDKGMLVLGGDFNSRCGMNGDEVVDTSGRQLLDFCSELGFEIVNNLAICKGDFTRVQTVEGAAISALPLTMCLCPIPSWTM